ncbi:MAG: type IV secretion system DNA-binding domain-containing protein [Prochloraceae cyanobacterium]|nr:type IV secretion system DNA-binding domain-containing protein [Prochloraceae cyanobacterium]
MFAKKEKPLPTPVLKANKVTTLSSDLNDNAIASINKPGVRIGFNTIWNPEKLPNGHLVAIGGSGSGKTQTLKAIAYDITNKYADTKVILIDFHGDQEIKGETYYPLNMASNHGINPLAINKDPEGGGVNLQAILVATTLKNSLKLGVNQEGLILEIISECYDRKGIIQSDISTWDKQPPNFSDIRTEIDKRIEAGCKESQKLKLKLAATFQYGVFSKPQPDLSAKLIRIDMHKLPPEIASIAAESLASQLMNKHRLMGEAKSKMPRTYLFIDEAKEMPKKPGSACDRILADGRKYGLAMVLASQSERHLSKDVIGNSSTKIVLPVDQTEVKKVASKFRFGESKVAELEPLTALCRFGKEAKFVRIIPYYQRVEEA